MRNESSAIVVVLSLAAVLSSLSSCGDSKASEDQLQREAQIAQDKAAIEKAKYLDGCRAIVTQTPYPEYSGNVEVEGRTVHVKGGGMKIDVLVGASYIESEPGLTFRVPENKARAVYCDPKEELEKGDIVSLHRYSVPGVPVGSLIAKKEASYREFIPEPNSASRNIYPESRATSR